ncbi:transposable element Tcb1 transposase [Microplitis demolitor]|uniref:transposable element Tcb1 transposase n=1 Tax=Microplitis demolitor TaxID=69319 RepID=UPI00235B67E9|nr:transposable element Tcb1 transposase [Microplitis demolitor]
MAKRKQITLEQRSAICTLREEGYSERQIAERLGISCKGVHYTLVRKQETGKNEDRKRSGRPKSTTNQEDNFIRVLSKRNRRLTAPQITAALNDTRETPISTTTVKRRLLSAGLRRCVAAKKPKLTNRHKKNRLEWAKAHKNWTIEQWENVLWSDESKFQIFGSNRRVFVRRSKEERASEACTVPTIKHGGGNVMVWGCFGNSKPGNLVRITGKLNKESYLKILQDSAIPSGLSLIGSGFIFQQDNDPKHSSKLCQNFLNKKKAENILNIMQWPSQSPDLSPIELVWDELDRRVKSRCPTSSEHLWQLLENEWNKLDKDYLKKLINRMPRICEKIIKEKGGHFDEAKI